MATPRRWLIPAAVPPSADRLRTELGLGPLAAKLLAHRGLSDPEAARLFLRADFSGLHDALLLRDMQPAVARLRQAIQAGEKVLIYGDYDVDGTTSVVLLTKAIELAGGAAAYHIPHRLKDGYGMRTEVVEAAAAQGVKLIISVDTGIRAAEVVRRAAEVGIDVIVTDHHLPEAELPPALAVINPNRRDCTYPNKDLCGAGVAFKLAQALLSGLGWPPEKLRRVTESLLKMVAIATVADVVLLTGENRVMVKHGLSGLNDVRNPGLRALLEVAGFTDGAAPDARQVAFQIAPRINAAGRMDTASAVVELFLTSDAARAGELARQLHDQNATRQQVEAEIRDICERMPISGTAVALVYYAEDWHRGVLGIVASRLVERLCRPVFVLGLNPEDGLAQGSGRSIAAFHLLDALESMSDLFVRFGGHSHAAGVTLETARVPEFRERFNAYAAARLTPEDLVPAMHMDAAIDLAEITEDSVMETFHLAPFGHGNPPPLYAALGVEVVGTPKPWGEKHLKVMVKQGRRTLALKAWGFAERAAEFVAGARIDIAFSLEADAYSAARGYPPWQAVLRDVRVCQDAHLAASSMRQ